jgi:tetratricopeptide (TPR) repeat protein
LENRHEREKLTINRLDSLLTKNLELCEIYYNRGVLYQYLYDYEKSVQDLETVIAITEKDETQREKLPQFLYVYSITLYYQANLEESLSKIDQAIQLASTDDYREEFEASVPEFRVHRACILDRLHRDDEAEQERQKVLSLNPDTNVRPLHIRLIDDGAVGIILSYLDGPTLSCTIRASRQLYNIYAQKMKPTANALMYRDSNYYREHLNLDGGGWPNTYETRWEDAENYYRLTGRQLLYVQKMRHIYGAGRDWSDRYEKEVALWRDRDVTNRTEDYERVMEFMRAFSTDYLARGMYPIQIRRLLENEGLKLGKTLFKSNVDYNENMYQCIKEQGPLLVIVRSGDVYFIGYTSKAVDTMESYIKDEHAWLYRSDRDTIHRVKKPERAVMFTQYRGGVVFGGNVNLSENDTTSCAMVTTSSYSNCLNKDDTYENWDPTDVEGYEYVSKNYTIHACEPLN